MGWLERRRQRRKEKEEVRQAYNRIFSSFHRHPDSVKDLEDVLLRERILEPGEKLEEIYTGPKHYVLEKDGEKMKELIEQGLFGLVKYGIYFLSSGGKSSILCHYGGVPVRKVSPIEDDSPYGKK